MSIEKNSDQDKEKLLEKVNGIDGKITFLSPQYLKFYQARASVRSRFHNWLMNSGIGQTLIDFGLVYHPVVVEKLKTEEENHDLAEMFFKAGIYRSLQEAKEKHLFVDSFTPNNSENADLLNMVDLKLELYVENWLYPTIVENNFQYPYDHKNALNDASKEIKDFIGEENFQKIEAAIPKRFELAKSKFQVSKLLQLIINKNYPAMVQLISFLPDFCYSLIVDSLRVDQFNQQVFRKEVYNFLLQQYLNNTSYFETLSSIWKDFGMYFDDASEKGQLLLEENLSEELKKVLTFSLTTFEEDYFKKVLFLLNHRIITTDFIQKKYPIHYATILEQVLLARMGKNNPVFLRTYKQPLIDCGLLSEELLLPTNQQQLVELYRSVNQSAGRKTCHPIILEHYQRYF